MKFVKALSYAQKGLVSNRSKMVRLFGTACCILLLLSVSLLVNCTSKAEPPSLQISPSSVATGGTVSITGKGFIPRSNVIILADTVIVGRGAAAVVVAETQADINGQISEDIVIPPPMAPTIPPKYAPATYTVRATDNKVVATASFTVSK